MEDHVPRCSVIAVVIRPDGRTLLIRRLHEPDAGLWGFPGGKVEFGEPLVRAATRELYEETGIIATGGTVIDALDVIGSAPNPYHYILIAVLMRPHEGEGVAGDDVSEIGWFPPQSLPTARSAGVDRVIAAATVTSPRPG